MIPSRLYDITAKQIKKDAPDNIAVGTITAEIEARRYSVLMEGRWRGLVRASSDTEFSVGDRVNLILPGGNLNNAQIIGLSSKTNPVTVTVTYGEGDHMRSGIEESLITMTDEAYIRAREELQGGKVGLRHTVPFLYRSGGENLRPGSTLRTTAPEAGLTGDNLFVESFDESFDNKSGLLLRVTGVKWEEWEAGEAVESGVEYMLSEDEYYMIDESDDYMISE